MGTPISKFFIANDIRREQRGISELALDIRAIGLLQPLLVQPAEGGDYEILDGRRRFYAMRDKLKFAELDENIHYVVREGLHALAAQFAANENREDFTPIEKALLIKEIHERGIAEQGQSVKGRAGGGGWSLETTGKIVNRDKGYISRMLKIAANADRFKSCRTLAECFDTLAKDVDKKRLSVVQKAKIAKVEELPDLSAQFKEIICSPAQDYISTVPSGSVDLIHTDPPFAINYDDLISTEQYDAPYEDDPEIIIALLLALIPEYYRVLRDDRYLILWCDFDHAHALRNKMIESGFTTLSSPIVWMKLSTAGKTHQPHIRLGSATQFALLAWKGTPELTIKGRHNYFPYPIVRTNRIHQAQMPEELIIDLVRIFSNESDTVLDTFCGSLSTFRACYATNRKFIGCELQQQNIDNGVSFSMDWIAERLLKEE